MRYKYLRKLGLALIIVSGMLCWRNLLLTKSINYLEKLVKEEPNVWEFEIAGQKTSRKYFVAELIGLIATRSELIELIKSEDKIVKCYSFWVLMRKIDKEKVKEIYQTNFDDSREIDVRGPCLAWNGTVKELIEKIVNKEEPFQRRSELIDDETAGQERKGYRREYIKYMTVRITLIVIEMIKDDLKSLSFASQKRLNKFETLRHI